jgi:hypothetical protein
MISRFVNFKLITLYFLQVSSEFAGRPTMTANVWWLGEGCLTESLNFAQMFMAAFAKPLLPAGRFISRNLN